MDIVESLVSSVVARRALLIEQFLTAHNGCWPGAEWTAPRGEPLTQMVKCSCGAQLEVVILTKLVIQSYQPKVA